MVPTLPRISIKAKQAIIRSDQTFISDLIQKETQTRTVLIGLKACTTVLKMSNFLLVIPEDVIKGCSKADKLVVTGEFDNWRHSDYVLQYDGSTQNYRVQIPRRKGQRSTMFKVVINDKKWVTLNYFDTVTDKSGYTNNILHFKDNEASQLMDIPLSPHTRSNTAKGNRKTTL